MRWLGRCLRFRHRHRHHMNAKRNKCQECVSVQQMTALITHSTLVSVVFCTQYSVLPTICQFICTICSSSVSVPFPSDYGDRLLARTESGFGICHCVKGNVSIAFASTSEIECCWFGWSHHLRLDGLMTGNNKWSQSSMCQRRCQRRHCRTLKLNGLEQWSSAHFFVHSDCYRIAVHAMRELIIFEQSFFVFLFGCIFVFSFTGRYQHG